MGTAGEHAQTWLRRSRDRLAPRTIEAYRYALERYAGGLLALPLAAWTPDTVRALLDELADRGMRGNSILAVRTALLALGRDAVESGVLETNPVAGVPRRRYVPREVPRTVLGPREVQALLAAAGSVSSPLTAPLYLMARAALRPGEVLGLHGGDVDLAERRALVRFTRHKGGRLGPPKGGRVRTVDLSRQTVGVLGRCRLVPGLVFGRLTLDRLERGLVRLCRLAEVPRVVPHSLRHSCLSALIAAGAPLVYVQRLAGHSDPRVTVQVYGSHLPNRNLAAVDQLDDPPPDPAPRPDRRRHPPRGIVVPFRRREKA